MKAVIWTKYGSPEGLQLREVDKPRPKDNEVLIKIHAATVTTGDCELRSLKLRAGLRLLLRLYTGLLRPRNLILGQELSGEIEALGKNVTRFKEGDQVFAATGLGFGAYAEYVCKPEDSVIALKPSTMSYEEAACVPTSGLEALHFLRMANIRNGQRVLVYGASGSIGTFAVQLAAHLGAEVTGVGNPRSLELLKSLGAVTAINYTSEDFTKNGLRYDVIFDTIGRSSFSRSLASLGKDGVYLLANPKWSQMFRGLLISRKGGRRVVSWPAEQRADDLLFLKGLIEKSALRSVIDRSYPLEEIVEAHRYVDTRQKTGNVILTLGPS